MRPTILALSLSLLAAACGKAADVSKPETAVKAEPPPATAPAATTPAAVEDGGSAAPAPTPAEPPKPADPAPAALNSEALMDPSKLNETAPATFKAKMHTTKGDFVIEVTRDWAPNGADRFYNMVKSGFFTDIAVFRVIEGFMAQFGIHGDPKVATAWRGARIQDDAVKQTNARGAVTFATAGPNTRTTQIFINFADNNRLDGMGFSPFGKIVEGMDVVDSLYKGYGEGAPRGRGPDQGRVQAEGNAYLKKEFPQLDYITSAEILP